VGTFFFTRTSTEGGFFVSVNVEGYFEFSFVWFGFVDRNGSTVPTERQERRSHGLPIRCPYRDKTNCP